MSEANETATNGTPRACHCSVADASTALEKTLELLASDVDRRVLRVSKHNERPISELVFCHRRCDQNPSEDIKTLVQALSKQPGMRSFSGESCHKGVYVGNNIWGRNFERRSTYCPSCGYGMSGPQIDHVEIVKSDDTEWNQRMIDQCEIGAYWHEGENVGLTYELV